jgi:hypothetical protein
LPGTNTFVPEGRWTFIFSCTQQNPLSLRDK